MDDQARKRRPALRLAAFCVLLAALGYGGWFALVHPKSPLISAWNPMTPLSLEDKLTPLTKWKLNKALDDPQACLAALETGANMHVLEDLEDNTQCHIRPQVLLSQVGTASLKPVNTRCQTALRLAMWERHGIQPAAMRHLGEPVSEILHLSSYNCRPIRTTNGDSDQMSSHATADAIDVSGFVLSTGHHITLLRNWDEPVAHSEFLRDVWDSACRWFRVTLSPEYNELHADHFHLQHTGWALCR